MDGVLFVPQTYGSLYNLFKGLKFREKGEVSIADSLGFYVCAEKLGWGTEFLVLFLPYVLSSLKAANN